MELEDLRRALALAEHPRLTDAATALRMNQPTLTRLVARVEQELGVRLVERDARGIRLNPDGELVLSAAREIVGRYDQLLRDLGNRLDPDSGTARLAFLDSMATSLVPQLLHDFRRQAPRVRVILRQEPAHEIVDDLDTGTAELAITSVPPAGPYGWTPLQRQRLVLLVASDHRLARRRRIRLAELAGNDLITVPGGFGFRAHVDELLAAAGVNLTVAFEIGDFGTIEGLVGAGLGVALAPEHFAGATTTVGLRVLDAGAERRIGLTWRTDRALAPPADRLRASIVSSAERIAGPGRATP
jgi:DNA-binding transcriptional LysR family regulator